MNLTKKEAIELHRKMWNWIADETEKQQGPVTKKDYFSSHPFIEKPNNVLCYCCAYAKEESMEEGWKTCLKCPLVWESGDGTIIFSCYANNSIYDLYNDACYIGDAINAAYYANKIANLPEKEDEICQQ